MCTFQAPYFSPPRTPWGFEDFRREDFLWDPDGYFRSPVASSYVKALSLLLQVFTEQKM
jgi:hypothetical protein